MEQERIPPETETKLQAVESDLQRFRETGNPQCLYYAFPRLQMLIERTRHQWEPEVDGR